MFSINTILIVVKIFASEEERKLWIIFLLLLCHMLKFWAISSHKICKLINYVLQFQICNACQINKIYHKCIQTILILTEMSDKNKWLKAMSQCGYKAINILSYKINCNINNNTEINNN